MARLTIKRLRDNVDAIDIGKKGLANDQHLKRKILKREFQATGDTALALVLHQQTKLEARHARAKLCANDRRTTAQAYRTNRRRDFRSPEGFNHCGADVGRSYVSRAAERKETKQAGFPDVMRHPTTLNLTIVPVTGDLRTENDLIRPRMRTAFDGLTEGKQVEGSFQESLHSAEYLASMIPDEEWPIGFDPVLRPDEIFCLLHWHGVICDPHLSKREVRKLLKKAFPGSHRICVRRVIPERTDEHGHTTHGAQGFLEYGLMDKTEVKFKKHQQKIDAVLGHALLGSTWNKRNRRFSMGQSLAKSGVLIDPDRVIELELMARLDHVRKNWKRLGYAEQFIHLWFSGMIKLVGKPQVWLNMSGNIIDRFKQIIQLLSNWCDDPTAEDTDFIDYVVASLE